MITGREIRRIVRLRAKRFEQQHQRPCHLACCMATDGHVHLLLATPDQLTAAKATVIGWAGYQVPVEACELQLQAIDRKIAKGKK